MSESSVFTYSVKFPIPLQEEEMQMQPKVAVCPLDANSLLHFSKSTSITHVFPPSIHLQGIHLLYFSTKRGHKFSFLPGEGTGVGYKL